MVSAVAALVVGPALGRLNREPPARGLRPVPREVHPAAESELGVVAHGLLASVDIVVGALATIEQDWDRLDDQRRRSVLRRASEQAAFVDGLLYDVVCALPAEVSTILDATMGERVLCREAPRRR